tara:strand:+ start:102 stop:629 length:528 start_codon:yes stop_codon:yes gene_type:complete
MKYYLNRNGENLGPYEKDQLKHMILSGKIDKEELICCDDGSDWRPASILLLKPFPASLPEVIPEEESLYQVRVNSPRAKITKVKPTYTTEGTGRLQYLGSIIGIHILIVLNVALTGGKTPIYTFFLMIIAILLFMATFGRIKNTGESQWMLLILFAPVASLFYIIHWCIKPPKIR